MELSPKTDFVLAIDVSGSMNETDCPGGTSRIAFAKEQAMTFAREAGKRDEDGIDLITFGHQVTDHRGITGEKGAEIIGGLSANQALTDTPSTIRKAWALHKSKTEQKPTVLFIVTDGEPNDGTPSAQDNVKALLRDIASKQVASEEEFSVSFLTVGKTSDALDAFLKDLDDNLKAIDVNGQPIDIVDYKRLEEVDFVGAWVGAVTD